MFQSITSVLSSSVYPRSTDPSSSTENNTVRFLLTHPDAIKPTKAHPSDIGYDLTAISIFKSFENGVTLYDTGIQVSPPSGYYTEILPRSSLSKTNYILANSVGVIDPDYRGNLLIAMRKIDSCQPDIELPFCKFQLVLRKAEYFDMVETESLNETVRGDGGFGSSG